MEGGGLKLLPLSAWTAAASAPVSCFSFVVASALMRLQHSGQLAAVVRSACSMEDLLCCTMHSCY
jgi:hypothetical protein